MKSFFQLFLKLNHFSIVFRSRLLSSSEVCFGKTLVWNDSSEKYEIQALSGPRRKVNQRWTPNDSMSTLLHPQLDNFEFSVMREKTVFGLAWCRNRVSSIERNLDYCLQPMSRYYWTKTKWQCWNLYRPWTRRKQEEFYFSCHADRLPF